MYSLIIDHIHSGIIDQGGKKFWNLIIDQVGIIDHGGKPQFYRYENKFCQVFYKVSNKSRVGILLKFRFKLG